MKLRNRSSAVAGGSEGRAPPARASRITQLIYLLALGILLFYIGRLVYEYFRYIDARGQVIVEEISLASPVSGEVEQLGAGAGETVGAGQLLARIDPEMVCGQDPALDPRLERVAHDLRLAAGTFELLRAQRDALELRNPATTVRRALEVERDAGDALRDWQRQMLDLKQDIAEQELLLSSLGEREQTLRELIAQTPPDPACQPRTIESPRAGTVRNVYRDTFEFIERGATLLTLRPDDAQVRIEVFTEAENSADLHVGQQVRLKLPDGSRATGRITEIKADASALPGRVYENNRPAVSGVLAIIQPPDASAAAVWRAFEQMELEVRIAR